jgi:uncharacterized protein YjiS (DUF1127 family)
MSSTIVFEPEGVRALRVRLGAIRTATITLVREWRRRLRSRLELASYSHDQRRDLGFAAELDAEVTKPFWQP